MKILASVLFDKEPFFGYIKLFISRKLTVFNTVTEVDNQTN